MKSENRYEFTIFTGKLDFEDPNFINSIVPETDIREQVSCNEFEVYDTFRKLLPENEGLYFMFKHESDDEPPIIVSKMTEEADGYFSSFKSNVNVEEKSSDKLLDFNKDIIQKIYEMRRNQCISNWDAAVHKFVTENKLDNAFIQMLIDFQPNQLIDRIYEQPRNDFDLTIKDLDFAGSATFVNDNKLYFSEYGLARYQNVLFAEVSNTYKDDKYGEITYEVDLDFLVEKLSMSTNDADEIYDKLEDEVNDFLNGCAGYISDSEYKMIFEKDDSDEEITETFDDEEEIQAKMAKAVQEYNEQEAEKKKEQESEEVPDPTDNPFTDFGEVDPSSEYISEDIDDDFEDEEVDDEGNVSFLEDEDDDGIDYDEINTLLKESPEGINGFILPNSVLKEILRYVDLDFVIEFFKKEKPTDFERFKTKFISENLSNEDILKLLQEKMK